MMKKRSRHLPESIETERLLLRSPRAGDGAEVNTAIRETFDALHVWMDWADRIPDVQETEGRCRSNHERFLAGEDFTMQVRLRTTGALVAYVGLHPLDWNVPKFEIGYWCRAAYQGQGYVSEAVRAVTRIGFEMLGANRLEIHCDARNIRSRRVAERAGYHLEARLRNDMVAPDGQLRDTLIFALLPEEFEKPH